MSRRYNEGTVDYHAPRQKWRLRVVVTAEDGRRRRRAYYFDDKDTATAERDRIRHESHSGDPVLPGPDTVETLFTRWLELRQSEVNSGQLARNTYRDYENTVKRHILLALGKRRLRENLAPAIEMFLAAAGKPTVRKVRDAEGKIVEKLLPPPLSFQRRLLVVLRQGFGLGVRWGLVSKNYASRDYVKAPPLPKPRPDAWSEAEAQRFLAACADSPYLPLWRFMLATGVREGEACGLQWENVDLDESMVYIKRQRLRSRKGEPAFGIVKTERSNRAILLDDGTVEMLREHKQRQAERRDKVKQSAAVEWHEHDLVFCTTTGTPYDLTNIGSYWRRDVRNSGVRPLKPHGTRHTHATLLLERGVPIEVVSRRLGHASTAFTADVYYRPQEMSARLAADSIAAALGAGAVTATGEKNGLQDWATEAGKDATARRLLSSLDSN